jgi:hypothetical protein
MSSSSDIVSRALNDKFREVSNPINLGRDFYTTLRQLVKASNRAFEKADISIGGEYHFVMDIDEAFRGSPLNPRPERSIVFFLGIHDVSGSTLRAEARDLRKKLVSLPEPSLLLKYHSNGSVDCMTTKKLIADEHVKTIKMSRAETFRVRDQKGIETFVASWLRANLSSRMMVAIEDEIRIQDEEEPSPWSQQQITRLNKFRCSP